MAIKGFEKKDPMANLNQLFQMMNQMSQMQDRKTRRHLSIEEDFSKGLNNVYDNGEISRRQQEFDSYFANNRDDMDSDTIDRFNLLSQKFKNQAIINQEYTDGMKYHKKIGRKVEESLTNYSIIQGMSVDDIEKQYADLFSDADQNISSEEKREQLRQAAMGDVQQLVNDYSDFRGKFQAKHSERLGKAGFRGDAAYIENLKEMFAFGIVQAKDDFVFDEEESKAMMLGIELGSYEPIRDYRAKEDNRNRNVSNSQFKNMTEQYQIVDEYQKLIDKADAYGRLLTNNPEEAAKMANEVWYINSNDEEVYYDSITGENERRATVKELESVRNDSKQNLLNIDKSYIRREGVSFLQDNNKSENLKSKGIFEVYEVDSTDDDGDDGGSDSGGTDDGGAGDDVVKKDKYPIKNTPLYQKNKVAIDKIINNKETFEKQLKELEDKLIKDYNYDSMDSLRKDIKEGKITVKDKELIKRLKEVGDIRNKLKDVSFRLRVINKNASKYK